MAAMAGGGSTPPAYGVDTVFSSTRNARTIYVANNKLNSLAVTQDATGNVWIGGYYDDNTNNFNKAMVAAFNGTTGAALTSYNTNGVYYHNQYDYDFVRSLYNVRGGKVYAAFTTAGGVLLDANSSGLGVNKVGMGFAPQCRAYAQANDTAIIGVTGMGGANPPQNRFYAFNTVAGTDFTTHQFANYYGTGANSFNSNISGAKCLAMQPDGKMLVATTPFEVYRYKAYSSQLDSTFGVNGYAYITPNNVPNIPCDAPEAADMLVEPNGAILYLLGNGGYSQLYRLNSNGTVDNTFNSNTGVVTLSMSYTSTSPCNYSGTVCTKLVRLSNGKIIVGGTELSGTSITYNPQGVSIMNGAGLGFYGFNSDGTADVAFGGGSNYLRINIWGNGLSYYEFPQLNAMYVNAADEIFVTGRYAVWASGAPSAEDAAFVTKLKPETVVDPCGSFVFEIEAVPAQNQDSTDGSIVISTITDTAPFTVVVKQNGSPYTSGSYSTLPIVISNIQASTGGYDVTVSNANGCSGSGSAIVASCYNFQIQANAVATSVAGVCDGSVTVNVSGSWGSPYTAAAGFLPSNVQFNSNSYLLSNTLCQGTGYTVTVEDGYGCERTAVFDILAGCTTPPTPTITQSNDTLYADTAGVSGGYDWYLNGNVIATTLFPDNYIVVTQNGSYTVIAGNGACVSSASTPFVVTTVGINKLSALNVSLYPVPVGNVLTISSDEQVESVEVYNAMGVRVAYEKDNVTSLNVSGLRAGLYSIRMYTAAGHYATKTFVKE